MSDDHRETVPSQREIDALGSIIPNKAGTVRFDHEYLQLTGPDGTDTVIREGMLAWGPQGVVHRVKRTITITVGQAQLTHVQTVEGGVEL